MSKLLSYILFIIILFYLLKVTKKYIIGITNFFLQNKVADPEDITVELVKDPYCGTYISKSQACKVRYKGEIVYFCSQDCLDKFKQKINES